jgi:transposase
MRPPLPGRPARSDFEYQRHGTRTLIGAFDIRTGEVFAHVRPKRRAQELMAFMEDVARRYPTGDVYIVWDNLNIHLGEAWRCFNERHRRRFHFVYTPIHASWVNQIEIWFGILQRRVLRYGDFRNTAELERKLVAFVRHWNAHEAHPFRWTFRGRFAEHQPSVDTSNPATDGHLKTGHQETSETGDVYPAAPSWRKSGWTLVRQLRGPHLRMWAWCSSRSRSAVTAALSPSSLPQSSTGRLEVRIVDARS